MTSSNADKKKNATSSSCIGGRDGMTQSKSSMVVVRRLLSLRDNNPYLPQPIQDMVPLIINCITYVSIYVYYGGQNGLKEVWTAWLLPRLLESITFLQDNENNSKDEEILFVYGIWILHVITYWGYSLLLFVLGQCIPPLQEFQQQRNESMPSWKQLLTNIMPLVMFNQVFIGIPILKVLYKVWSWNNYENDEVDEDSSSYSSSSFSSSTLITSIPSIPYFLCMTLGLYSLIIEIWFYIIHRFILHTPRVYNTIHKYHHNYHTPIACIAGYCHPIEYLINAFTVLVIPLIVTKASLIQCYFWIVITTFLSCHDHCGYHLPFLPNNSRHDLHHAKINTSYGIIGLMDNLFQTEYCNNKEEERQKDKDKKK